MPPANTSVFTQSCGKGPDPFGCLKAEQCDRFCGLDICGFHGQQVTHARAGLRYPRQTGFETGGFEPARQWQYCRHAGQGMVK